MPSLPSCADKDVGYKPDLSEDVSGCWFGRSGLSQLRFGKPIRRWLDIFQPLGEQLRQILGNSLVRDCAADNTPACSRQASVPGSRLRTTIRPSLMTPFCR